MYNKDSVMKTKNWKPHSGDRSIELYKDVLERGIGFQNYDFSPGSMDNMCRYCLEKDPIGCLTRLGDHTEFINNLNNKKEKRGRPRKHPPPNYTRDPSNYNQYISNFIKNCSNNHTPQQKFNMAIASWNKNKNGNG